MRSLDLTEKNIKKIGELFPNVITEVQAKDGSITHAIDFDLLKQELSSTVVEGPVERYQLDWPGKRESLLAANAPIAKTLRPEPEESVDFDTTENLFIEGDNLEALKLLQESYLGKVKMIYIDPPYNTGNDFVYNDDFAEDAEEYLERSLQKNENGDRLVSNTESNGRFHSDWLSMMHSRLRLARNLLTDDGVIFLSIDDGEQSNLKKLCNEVFGKNNYVTTYIWQNKKGGGNDSKFCAVEHEYIICYTKNINNLKPMFEKYSDKYAQRYKEQDEIGLFYWDTFKRKSGKQYYPITCPDGTVLEYDKDGTPLSWLRSEARFQKDLAIGDVKIEKNPQGEWGVYFKQRKPLGKKPRSIINDKGTTNLGNDQFKHLFDRNYFDNPKPVDLLKHLIGISCNPESLILDFFAGSSTTAHAVMQLNAEDGGNRKFIMVQLPEATDEKSEAYKAGYQTIAEISKERIRRAGKQILESENIHEDWNRDIGFRVLKVDSSNMKEVYYQPQELTQADLLDQVDNVKEDRTPEDLLFQVMLDWGLELSLPITTEEIEGKKVFFVADDALIACFDAGITESLVQTLAAKEPLRLLFRDNHYLDNDTKINAEQLVKQIAPNTELKSI